MPVAPAIFRQYDIRGVVGKDLTVEAAHQIGRAYAAYLAAEGLIGAVAVGRDNRPSGEALRDALVEGLTTSGIDVVDIGVVPTPLLYWALHHVGVAGGIQITGSHNPPEYNGFKLSVGTSSLHGENVQRLREIGEAGRFPSGQGSVRSCQVIEAYIEDVVQRVGPLARPLRVVYDCGNGAGSLIAPQLFEKLGVRGRGIFCESDGTFPNHHPDPTVEANLVDLIKAVKRDRADIGIAFDGDADRIGVVARRPRAGRQGPADHLRRQVLSGAAAGSGGRWRAPGDVEDRTLAHQGQNEGDGGAGGGRDVRPHVLR
jgi:phosphomannomutase/phosphoglucomutase